ncbi:alkylmercury (organomercurial) lyase MerB [Mycobacterium kiyosense]|uniref:organomercurial lyase MerB n=1 Tax=Mycobacterium kiyosense TaxID=2871094 RepID=UPI0021725E1C|nr:organomercurial lyase MerB [Mycobacterium kiyosense]GLD45106.1 alkylmercury (organomercurial) lyase MerB [Mycobacterium kiyosense]
MTPDIAQLAHRLNDSLGDTKNPGSKPWLFRPLLELLAQGQPVTIDQIADATASTVEQVRDALVAMPDTEYDERGRIVGSGLTLRPTPHHFEIDGRQLYTWCALDTLIFPAILDRTADVTSPCHSTGQPVHLTIGTDGITSVEPATAVVSIVTPDAPTSIRAAFCNHVHFFANPEAAQPWLGEHPSGSILPVADAYQLGRPLTQTLLESDAAPGCC